MTKKYKLQIPDDLLLIVPSKTRGLNGKTVEIEEDNELITVIIEPGKETVYHHVKRLWLEPIEPGIETPTQIHHRLNEMHTTHINNTIFQHNGGYDGDVHIKRQNDHGSILLIVPFDDLKAFVANYIRGEKISHLENCTDDEILFQQVKK